MKAIVAYGAKDYRFCEIDTPKAGKGEILIKIEAAGICASDRAVYMGGDPWGGIPHIHLTMRNDAAAHF